MSAGWSDLLSPSVDRTSDGSLFRQLYGEMRRAILAGAAAPGHRLPATRYLAGKLGISRTSMVDVYEQLVAEGYAEGRPGPGTFVSQALLERPAKAPASAGLQAADRPGPGQRCARLKPDPAQFASVPFNVGRCTLDDRTLQVWLRLTAQQLRWADPLWLGYTGPRGSPRLREAVARYLRAARGVVCDRGQIMILSGVQQAIDQVPGRRDGGGCAADKPA